MSVNKVILVGNLGKDPELRYTASGTAVASFSLATTEKFKDREGQKKEVTTWHNIIAWRQLAEICGKYLHKGKQIYIEGKLQTRSYDNRDGVKVYVTEVVADQMMMLGSKSDGHPVDRSSEGSSQPAQGGGFEEPAFNPDDEIPF